MAKKATAKKGGAAKPKAKPASPGPGHNLKVDRALTKETFERLDQLHKDKASDASSWASKIGDVYEAKARELGVSQKALKEAYDEHKFEKKKIARRKEMDPEIANQVDKLILAAASYKTSPLFAAAEERAERQAIAKETGSKDDEKADA